MPAIDRNLETARAGNPLRRLVSVLSEIQIGGHARDTPARRKITRHDLSFILRNLATLVSNGLALPTSLDTLAKERSMRKHAEMLRKLRQRIETGETFSKALAEFPRVFDKVMVNQIRAGERVGELPAALRRVAKQVENTNKLRMKVIRQLSYPAFLVTAAIVAVAFMLVFVIPVFEETYAEAKIPLPTITVGLMAAGEYSVDYGWIIPLAVVAGVLGIRQARKQSHMALWIDRTMLRVPLVGGWLRNMAVLQFIDVFGNLMESGLRLVDALELSSSSVGNRAVRQSVRTLQRAVMRGERFGRELTAMGDLFPPVVGQLIAVGEKTGNLPKATAHIRTHLEQEVERQTAAMVGTIEPVMTIGLAAVIASILLAIYLPMFDMIGAVNTG